MQWKAVISITFHVAYLGASMDCPLNCLSMSSANVDRFATLSAVTSVLHVTGCAPDPCIHLVKISRLMESEQK